MTNTIVKRMLSHKEAQEYLGLKGVKCREFGESVHAIKRIGKRVLYDRTVLDAALDSGFEFCIKGTTDPDKHLMVSAK